MAYAVTAPRPTTDKRKQRPPCGFARARPEPCAVAPSAQPSPCTTTPCSSPSCNQARALTCMLRRLGGLTVGGDTHWPVFGSTGGSVNDAAQSGCASAIRSSFLYLRHCRLWRPPFGRFGSINGILSVESFPRASSRSSMHARAIVSEPDVACMPKGLCAHGCTKS
jgi:hypothetical protein